MLDPRQDSKNFEPDPEGNAQYVSQEKYLRKKRKTSIGCAFKKGEKCDPNIEMAV